MVVTLGNDAPSYMYPSVKRWVPEFKLVRQSSHEDEPHPGRPVTVAAPEMANKIHDIVIADRQVTETYSPMIVTAERVHYILTKYLAMLRSQAVVYQVF